MSSEGARSAIREATVADLARMETAAREFYASSRFLDHFDLGMFTGTWRTLLESGRGVIFALFDEAGDVAGALGGIVYPELYTGRKIATEFFWFVRAGHRGEGLKLYRAFEEWARAKECAEIRMVHLMDSMPEKLERVYRRLGFEPAEVHYVKELSKAPFGRAEMHCVGDLA